jgi:Xaa-Pro dipeptidase
VQTPPPSVPEQFDPRQFEAHVTTVNGRWHDALAASHFDAAVIAAGQPRNYFQDDQSPVFRANPDFAQFVPTDDCVEANLLVRRGERPVLFFLAAEDFWHPPPVIPGWTAGAIDIRVFNDSNSLRVELARSISAAGRCVLMGEAADSNLGCEAQNATSVLNRVHYQRALKTPFELAALRSATMTAVNGHLAARDAFLRGESEYGINLAYLDASRQVASDLPYGNIVALNQHAAALHYPLFDRHEPAERFSFLIDAGARTFGYAADITRTWAWPDGQVQADFAAMITAFDVRQRELTAAVKPGVSFLALHELAHRAVARTLLESGLINCSAEEAFDSGLTRNFLPHGLGHLVGIQTHDVGGHQVSPSGELAPPPQVYPALRLTRTLEPGFVFTVEPGLYFIPLLLRQLKNAVAARHVNWAAVERLLPCGGIRIEDNVRVTTDGHENYTRDAFAAAGFFA